ncbi:unnamed protein product [Brassica rapa subsp. narinosa]
MSNQAYKKNTTRDFWDKIKRKKYLMQVATQGVSGGLDEISGLFSMKLSVGKHGDEDGYGFATAFSGETSGVLRLLRLTLMFGVPML